MTPPTLLSFLVFFGILLSVRKFLRRRLSQKNSGLSAKFFFRKKSYRKRIFLGLFFFLLLFFIFFLGRIFFGNLGVLTRKFPKFWNFSAVVLLQNDAELRPTGGFLSGFLIVEIRHGIPHFQFFDSYSITPPPEKIPAPAAMNEVFSVDPKFEGWVARDANFNPDFSTSAEQFLRFLAFDPRFSSTSFDAVVAVNFSAVEDFVRVFLGKSAAQNLFLDLQRASKNIDLHDTLDLAARKNVVGKTLDELRDAVGFFGLPKFLDLLALEADKRNVQFFFSDADLAKIAHEKNWDGALPQEDFWGINLANLGARKSDRFTRRHFFSEITTDEAHHTREKLTVVLENPSKPNILTGPGKVFVRIFRPLGTTFDEVIPPNFSQRNFEHFTEFSTIVSVAPGKRTEFSVSFALPAFPQKILWHGQSGAGAMLSLSIVGAGETRFFAEGCRGGLVLLCEKNLAPDAEILVEKLPDKTPPFLENALFTNDREIFLRFSEKIIPEGDPTKWTISCGDQDFSVEKIVFSSAEKRDATILLSKSVGREKGFCVLRWSGITDLFGNQGAGKMTIPRKFSQ